MNTVDETTGLNQVPVTEADVLDTYLWKGQKVLNKDGTYEQETVRLVDASDEQLRKFHKHCKTMLFNTDPKFPGRLTLFNIIGDQKDRCGVELFFRHAKENHGSSPYSIVEAIRELLTENNRTMNDVDDLYLGEVVNTSSEYERLPLGLVIDGGLAKLGKFDRKYMTLTFIIDQGIWFTEEERKEYAELYKTGNEKLQAVKEALKIPDNLRLRFNAATGLSVKEMKSILLLKSKRYNELSTDQLSTLRYKLLLNLENRITEHIAQWNARIGQLEIVAKSRGINLKSE